MKLSDLPTHQEVLTEHLDTDPEYRREWERTALARAVAVKVISYRAEHGRGFQPVESGCFLKCVLVQNGVVRYVGSTSSVDTTSSASPFGRSKRSMNSVITASALYGTPFFRR